MYNVISLVPRVSPPLACNYCSDELCTGVQRSSLAIIHARTEGRAWGRGYNVMSCVLDAKYGLGYLRIPCAQHCGLTLCLII